MKLDGISALITGGASGLGNATATRLAAQGVSVVIVDLPSSQGADAAGRLGGNARFIAADVTNEDQVQAAVDAAVALAPLKLVVNCAGVATPGKVLGRDGTLPLATFTTVIQINLIGTFNVLRLAAAKMSQIEPDENGSRGLIVNTASVAAFDGQIGQPAYAASKGAVHAMTLPVARELARFGIRVNTIAPGIMETPMLMGLPQEAQDSLGTQVPFPSRLGRPDEYAALVQHLAENDYLNGETIRLDGAIRMAPK
ncbi:SDR family NAD(P)-dependent oxidoreductase [Mycetocola zhadangensis]|uniref:SDR family NAD(P)-dependent oxidoreductase n=1 Tax=Mycetocola zhadangensis TaxID=1164595 RepID=UPI003A4E55E0